MKDKSILTMRSYNVHENAVTHFYVSGKTAIPHSPVPVPVPAPAHQPERYSFIMPLGDSKIIIRVTYFYSTHPTMENWYIIDLAISGLTEDHRCFEALLYYGEPYYDVEFKKDLVCGDFFVRGRNSRDQDFADVAVHTMDEIIPKIFEVNF
jgi:hypothetical protein